MSIWRIGRVIGHRFIGRCIMPIYLLRAFTSHIICLALILSIRLLLLQRPDIDPSLKDLEGYTPFDLYNSTLNGTKPSLDDKRAELFTWGTNRFVTLLHQPHPPHPHPVSQKRSSGTRRRGRQNLPGPNRNPTPNQPSRATEDGFSSEVFAHPCTPSPNVQAAHRCCCPFLILTLT